MRHIKKTEGLRKLSKECDVCPYSQRPNYNRAHPVFSFVYMQDTYHFSKCSQSDQSAFTGKLIELSHLTWQDIELASRHGCGKEIIARSAIKVSVPNCVKEDTNLIALRFSGKKPMVGFRERNVFHVLWIDRDFTLYNHG